MDESPEIPFGANQTQVNRKFPFNVNSFLVFLIGFSIPIGVLLIVPVENMPFLNKKIFTLPVNTESVYVEDFGLLYFFKGRIENILKEGEYVEIITNIEGKNIPRFIIKPATSIFKQAQTGYDRTTIDSIQIGQTVSISAYYSDLKNWETTRVSILR